VPNQFLTNLAGLSFRPAEIKDVVRQLQPGDELTLEREPDNAYDANAIRILKPYDRAPTQEEAESLFDFTNDENTTVQDFHFIGYVEALANGPIALAMDAGKRATAKVEKVYEEIPKDKTWMRPLISIEVESDADSIAANT
jgi:hypothetical protein